MLTFTWFRPARFALDSLRRGRKQQLARRRPWLEELEPRLAPATVQFSAASETINEAAGTFSIPVTLTGSPQATVSPFASSTLFSSQGPDALTIDADGNLYAADPGGSTAVFKITPAGVVSPFASSSLFSSQGPDALTIDADGNLYAADPGGSTAVFKITPAGVVSPFASSTLFSSQGPDALTIDADGNLYAADPGGSTAVFKITPTGVVSPFASSSLFSSQGPDALTIDAAGNLYAADPGGSTAVFKITPTGVVSPFASSSLFSSQGPNALIIDAAGNLYAADPGNATAVFKITPAGVVSPFASSALFSSQGPDALTIDAAGNLYAADPGGSTAVFKITETVGGPVSVPFTLGGTARSGIDYRGVTASPLVLAAGLTSGTITGTLLSDPGPSQTLTFTLDTPSGASPGSPTVNTLTITQPPPVSPPPVSPPPPSSAVDELGAYRASDGSWSLDSDSTPGFNSATDQVFYSFSSPNVTGVAGDWTGSGTTKIGDFSNGVWHLDLDGNGILDPGETFTFGQAGDKPVVGDWTGNGVTSIGVFRNNGTGVGEFILDTNGDHIMDAGDETFTFGLATDRIVVGDWNGAGKDEVGVFRNAVSFNPAEAGDAIFSLDTNNDHTFDAGDAVFVFGLITDGLIVGDWNGSGRSEVGVYRDASSVPVGNPLYVPGTALFSLDTNGDLQFDSGDQVFLYGLDSDQFVSGHWKKTPPLQPEGTPQAQFAANGPGPGGVAPLTKRSWCRCCNRRSPPGWPTAPARRCWKRHTCRSVPLETTWSAGPAATRSRWIPRRTAGAGTPTRRMRTLLRQTRTACKHARQSGGRPDGPADRGGTRIGPCVGLERH